MVLLIEKNHILTFFVTWKMQVLCCFYQCNNCWYNYEMGGIAFKSMENNKEHTSENEELK